MESLRIDFVVDLCLCCIFVFFCCDFGVKWWWYGYVFVCGYGGGMMIIVVVDGFVLGNFGFNGWVWYIDEVNWVVGGFLYGMNN